MEQNNLKTKNFWSKGLVAWLYKKFAGRHFIKIHKFIGSIILTSGVKSVLDIACGPGDFLFYLKEQDPSIQFFGTDLAPGMVLYAQKKLGEKVIIKESNSENQPFPDKSFDVVTVMMAFHHFSNQLETLKEIMRILKPSGECIIVDVIAKSESQKKFWNFLEKITGVRGYVGHYTEFDLEQLAEKAGYMHFKCEFIPKMAKRYKVCRLKNVN